MGDFLKRRNWWKIGFFVALFLFEWTREIYVAQGAEPLGVASSFYVSEYGGYTTAVGRWRRIDGGGDLMPAAVEIQCSRDEGECVETTATAYDGTIMLPQTDTFAAIFAPGRVSYSNDSPDCATYTVSIDTRQSLVTAVRTRKDNPANEQCKLLEKRIEMRLADGYQADEARRNLDTTLDDHFLPLLEVTMGIVAALD